MSDFLREVVEKGLNAPSGERICTCHNPNAVKEGLETPCWYCELHAALAARPVEAKAEAGDFERIVDAVSRVIGENSDNDDDTDIAEAVIKTVFNFIRPAPAANTDGLQHVTHEYPDETNKAADAYCASPTPAELIPFRDGLENWLDDYLHKHLEDKASGQMAFEITEHVIAWLPEDIWQRLQTDPPQKPPILAAEPEPDLREAVAREEVHQIELAMEDWKQHGHRGRKAHAESIFARLSALFEGAGGYGEGVSDGADCWRADRESLRRAMWGVKTEAWSTFNTPGISEEIAERVKKIGKIADSAIAALAARPVEAKADAGDRALLAPHEEAPGSVVGHCEKCGEINITTVTQTGPNEGKHYNARTKEMCGPVRWERTIDEKLSSIQEAGKHSFPTAGLPGSEEAVDASS